MAGARYNHHVDRRASTRVVWFVSLASGLAVWGGAVAAHHSLTGAYDTELRTTLDGTVVEFHFVNPHPFITIEVSRNGSASRWRLELDNRSELAEIGVTAATWKPGDRIVVSGSPGRAQAQNLYVRRLDRPADGSWYEQVGSTPRIGGRRSR